MPENLEQKIDTLNINLNRILGYLESDDKTKRKGLVQEVDELKTVVSELLTRERVYKTRASAFGAGAALAVGACYKIITYLINFIK